MSRLLRLRPVALVALVTLVAPPGCRKTRVARAAPDLGARTSVRAAAAPPARQHDSKQGQLGDHPSGACQRLKSITRKREAVPRSPSDPAMRYDVVLDIDGTCRIQQGRLCVWPSRDQGYSALRLRHHALKGKELLLTIPEELRFYKGTEAMPPARFMGQEPRWRLKDNRLSYDRLWVLKDEQKRSVRLRTTWSVSCAASTGVSLMLTMKNEGKARLDRVEVVVCLAARECSCGAGLPMLSGVGGARRLAYTVMGWTQLRENSALWVEGAPTLGSLRHGRELKAQLAVAVAHNPKQGWLMAIGWDHASNVHAAALECIHAHPYAVGLAPGQQVTRRGRVYFFKGSLADLKEAYRRDLVSGK